MMEGSWTGSVLVKGGSYGSGSRTQLNTQDLPVGAAEGGGAGAGPHVVHQLAHTPQFTLVAAAEKGRWEQSFSAYYLLKVQLHHFSKMISQKEVTEQQESRFFLLFLLIDRRIRIHKSD